MGPEMPDREWEVESFRRQEPSHAGEFTNVFIEPELERWKSARALLGFRRAGATSVEVTTVNEENVENDASYTVVVNHEGQYSLWPADRPPPAGWSEAGKRGSRAECLAFVDEVWTDMRPLSLRDKMGESR
jgi:MbtH protein